MTHQIENQDGGPRLSASMPWHTVPELDAIGAAAEHLFTLPASERRRAERPAVAELHGLIVGEMVNNAMFASSDVHRARRTMQGLLAAILRRGTPVEESEFLQIMRSLVEIGCWGQTEPSQERGR